MRDGQEPGQPFLRVLARADPPLGRVRWRYATATDVPRRPPPARLLHRYGESPDREHHDAGESRGIATGDSLGERRAKPSAPADACQRERAG
jgi:hypothetical protein